MKFRNLITVISLVITVLSSFAASVGIFSERKAGPDVITSVRGAQVKLYGKGVYHHMSLEVAPQGIAQDVVTLFIAVPLLLISVILYRKGSLRGKILLTGTLGYFLVTYLFFLMMAMYNEMFLVWVVLLSLSFYGFILAFLSIDKHEIAASARRFSSKAAGGFLIFTAVIIALLWLSIVVPPALSGTIPPATEHYTTLVVQALDLSILLPASFIAGVLLWKRKSMGYKLALVYLVFLALLMTALTAKVLAMNYLGYNVVPVIFIIPAFNLLALFFAALALKRMQDNIAPALLI